MAHTEEAIECRDETSHEVSDLVSHTEQEFSAEGAVNRTEHTAQDVARLDLHTSQAQVNVTSRSILRLVSQLSQAQRNACKPLSTWVIVQIFKLKIKNTSYRWKFLLPLEHEIQRLQLKSASATTETEYKLATLQGLPQDVKLHIISFLVPVHATALGITCKSFYFAFKHVYPAPLSLETAVWERCMQCGGGIVRHKLHEYLRGWVRARRLKYDAGKGIWVQPVLSLRTWGFKAGDCRKRVLRRLEKRGKDRKAEMNGETHERRGFTVVGASEVVGK